MSKRRNEPEPTIVSEEPAAEEPVAEQEPVAEEVPVVTEPAAGESTEGEPTVILPVVTEPAAGEPAEGEPTATGRARGVGVAASRRVQPARSTSDMDARLPVVTVERTRRGRGAQTRIHQA